MSEEEGQGFVVRDRRGRTEPEPDPTPTPEPPPSETAAQPSMSGQESDPAEHSLPVTFSSFVFSLGTSSLMLMGESLDPQQPSIPINLPQAKEIIDILSMLQEKTKGNLSSDESSVIGDMLYTLRMKYVALTSSTPQSSSS
ncbi:MAG: DUF1844 domain-containing protein [Nitrospirales bacterium]|nr:DUF1844 domain-containing protein [Nitrospira sp.]MDR4499855.1 DUF1844 domain-containing protein [Nitrospirales bacterium]